MGSQSVSVFGLGYVGSVTATCLAFKGNNVLGVDVNPAKVGALNSGRSPVIEARLDELAAQCHKACQLQATTDAAVAVSESKISFICVGTPSLRNGKLDLSGVERVCQDIGEALRNKNSFHLIVLRSTVMPGTTEALVIPSLERSSGKRSGSDFAVCFNPEFLREGTAVADFMQPPFTIIGAQNPEHLALLRELYSGVPGKMFETSLATAEMVKYVCNAFHALKVSFANEVGTLSKQLGVDTEAVTQIFTSDTTLNISAAYLEPGFAFGGSCLPKDLRALLYRAKEEDLSLPLLESILPSNREHIERAVEAVLRTNKKKIGVLGLSFKAGTDDLRESPLVHFVKRLLGEGCDVYIWDKNVALGRLLGSNRQFIEDTIPHIGKLLCPSLQELVKVAEVMVIGTRIDKATLLPLIRPTQFILDFVNLERDRRLQTSGLYEGICW